MHELRLCLALGKTLQELRQSCDAQEYLTWLAYEHLYGLPQTRIEHAVALSGSAVAASMGAKVRAKDLLPVYERVEPVRGQMATELLKGWAAMHNSTPRNAK